MREFRQTKGRTSKPVVWMVDVEDNAVHTTWGQLDGKMQGTTQTFKAVNVGKSNEKSPQQVAQEFADRQVLKKTREGFKEFDHETGELIGESADSIESFIELPPNMRLYKPQNSLPKYLINLAEKGKAWFVRKRNGEMMVASKGEDGHFRFYSSKLLPSHKDEADEGIPWSDRFPHLLGVLKRYDIPDRSVLAGELVSGRYEDDLYRVGSVMKSLTPRALELQQKEGPLWYCIWDVIFWSGKNLLETMTYRERLQVLKRAIATPFPDYLTLPEREAPAADESVIDAMKEQAKDKGWEGYVVVDPEVPYGEKGVSFHGKAERPKYCGKLKPTLEADFIAMWDPDNDIGTWGKGKKSGGVGALFLYLLDEETGENVYISKCGGGLTDEDVFKLADPSLYPLVVEVEFAAWTPKGSIQFPELKRVRHDKDPEDCTLSQRPEVE